MPKILVVDDDIVNAKLIAEILEEDGAEVVTSSSPVEAIRIGDARSFDLAIVDVRMGELDGVSLLKRLRTRDPSLPILVMTGFGSVEGAVEAISAGAVDYLSKPMNIDQLRSAVRRSLHTAAGSAQRLPVDQGDDEMVGRGEAMVDVYRTIAKVAPGRSTVLLRGESGTGKELVARAIHRHSQRKAGPFIAIDCGAIPESLLESELFGYTKGSFTGALVDKPGLFSEADGGTLLLDEIGNVSLAMQARLLRVLQDQQVRPIGSNRPRSVDVRIVAATNLDLEAAVARGSFRQDLYYRLNVVSIAIPPLRDRAEDIPLLVEAFLHRAARQNSKPVLSVTPEAMQALVAYEWPGNVRELAHVVERVVVLSQSDPIGVEDLPLEVRGSRAGTPDDLTVDHPTLEELKRRYIVRVVAEAQGNISRAAAVLGVDRRSLYRMMRRYKINPSESRRSSEATVR